MTKAYSYLRFSSAKQEQGDSLRRQQELAERYVETHNLQLDTSLTLSDLGVSAFKGDNVAKGALGKFVEAIEQGLVPTGSFLLVENLDRLSRQQVTTALELFLSITRMGITIVTLQDGMQYSKENINQNWTQLVVALALMASAHEQSKNKAERIGSAWDQKRKTAATKRMTKTCPAWIRPTEDGWDVIVDKAYGVRRAFQLFAEGYGKSSIAKLLNEEKVPSLSDKGWHDATIQKLLNNRAVLGEFQPHTGRHPNRVPVGEPIKNYYPQIIDDDLWASAQRPKRGGGGARFKDMVNVFRGLLRCPHCGGRITTYSGSRPNKPVYRHLACYNNRRGLCNVKEKWKYDEFLENFLQMVREVDLSTIMGEGDAVKNTRNQINMMRVGLEALDKKINNVAMSILDDPSPTLNKMLRNLEAERYEANKQLKQLEDNFAARTLSTQAVQECLEEATTQLSDPNFRVKLNSMLCQIIDRIEIYLGGTGINIAPAISDEVVPDTSPSYTVCFKNGYTRMVKAGWTMKIDFRKTQ